MAPPPTQSKISGKPIVLLEPQFPYLASVGLLEALYELRCSGSVPQATTRGSFLPSLREKALESKGDPLPPLSWALILRAGVLRTVMCNPKDSEQKRGDSIPRATQQFGAVVASGPLWAPTGRNLSAHVAARRDQASEYSLFSMQAGRPLGWGVEAGGCGSNGRCLAYRHSESQFLPL